MSSLSTKAIRSFHRKLHHWYSLHGRKDLPWRKTDDPYAIYISEIMLQQTQVTTVLGRYYQPFLRKFPTITSLAKAPRRAVLSAWQGLGYYNRAINLHKTAKQCKNGLPKDISELMELPGIGRNTAHAVATFAYRQPVAVMEANVRRVLTRIFALRAPTPAVLWEKAGLLLDKENPFDYNQAMMDIGATICTRTAPQCTKCPAGTICAGKFSPLSFPKPKAAKKIPTRKKQIIVFINHKNEIYAHTREGRFLSGLYHFIEIKADQRSVAFMDNRYPLTKGKMIGHVKQQYSHFTLEADVYTLPAGRIKGRNWYALARFKTLPKSMLETKILALLS